MSHIDILKNYGVEICTMTDTFILKKIEAATKNIFGFVLKLNANPGSFQTLKWIPC